MGGTEHGMFVRTQRATMKRISRWSLLIGLGISLVATSGWTGEVPPTSAVKASIERGNALLHADDYPAAVKAFDEALRLDPKNVPAHIGRGTAYRLAGKLDQAMADFDEALRLEPRNSEAHRGRGGVWWDKKDFDKALAECDEAVRCDPENSAAYRSRGNVHTANGEYDQAFADLTEAVRLNPKDADAYCGRGCAYAYIGEYGKAIADLTEAVRLSPKDADAYCRRGCAYVYFGEYDKAFADLTEAVRLNPKDADAYCGRGCAYVYIGEYDKAIADLTEAIRLDPKDAKAYNNRGDAYAGKGEYDKAIADLTEGIRLDPKDAKAYNNRGGVCLAKGEYDKAIADLTEGIRLDPKDAKAYDIRGVAYASKGEYDKAIADHTAALRLNPKDAVAYCKRGEAHGKKGETKKAEADFAQAAQLRLRAVLGKRGLPELPASQAAVKAVEKRIHAEVKLLEYPDAVAAELVAMVRDWDLAALQQKLASAKDRQRHHKLSKEQLSRTERDSAETLCQEIEAVVRPADDVRELDDVVRSKSACCMGHALLFDVLGRSIGLDAEVLDIPVMACGQSIDDQGHMACLVRLADGQAAIADVTGDLGGEVLISGPFRFAETYGEKGSYWELKDAAQSVGPAPARSAAGQRRCCFRNSQLPSGKMHGQRRSEVRQGPAGRGNSPKSKESVWPTSIGRDSKWIREVGTAPLPT